LVLYKEVPPGARVLDVGCGPAISAAMLPSVEYFGFDFSSFALKTAERTRENIRGLVRGNAMWLPFPSAAFDVVISLRLIEYIIDPHRFLLEVIRVLKPGGLFLLNGPAWELPWVVPPSGRNIQGVRRKAFIAKRFARQWLHQILRNRAYFEIMPEVAAVTDGHKVSDDDALHIVSPYQIERFLSLQGMAVLYRRRDDDISAWPRQSGLRHLLKKLLLSLPPYTTGYTSCNIIARKPQ